MRPLLQAIARACEAEGVVLSELHSIHFADDEISIHIRRGDGRTRINTYPIAALRALANGGAPSILPRPIDQQLA